MSPRRERSGWARSRRDVIPDLLVLAPLALEAAAVGRSRPSIRVMRTGMGPLRATHASDQAAAVPARAVAVVGLCGALDPALSPGDLVVASEIIGPNRRLPCPATGPLVAALRAAGLEPRVGPIASVDHVVSGSERGDLRRAGAIAVDMESAWLASAAAGRPLAVIRAVVDTPGRELARPLATMLGGLGALRTLQRSVPALHRWATGAGSRRVLLAAPRSFCAGVDRAVEIVERALDRYGPPVYVRKQIVHNVHVVRDLERRGAVFVESVQEVPEGKLVVFSAHGVSPAVREQAVRRKLRVIDATCPLVTKVHAEARRFARAGYSIVLVGHAGHEEIEGTSGEAPGSIRLLERPEDVEALGLDQADRVAYLTQTTLSVDEVDEVVERLRRRFPTLVGPGSEDICYATSNRQAAVRTLARDADLMLVIGSGNSSNSKRLVEVAQREGCPARLIDDDAEIDPAWLRDVRTVALTAGASAPETIVDRVIAALRGLGPVEVEERHVVEESMQFTLPIELRGGKSRPANKEG
jgi:4-hydroxy-3-methylbut-2-en-1-yl diphosphate reductase